MARPGNIKGKHNWANQKARHVHDRNGHGTFAAGLILDFAPDAELYIVKIADDQPCSPATVAEVFLPSHFHHALLNASSRRLTTR